ncbi:lytic transglycosylase domain-containing protein [Aquibium microcysteis]|uniref:transglycosylase SLT domain-containing protein n=1 Tax=Aquibium microcysteis TaxID=675281 RepID=UPI00165CF7C5
MTPSRLAALSACFLAATALGACSTSGISASDMLTLAPVETPQQMAVAAEQPEVPADEPAPPVSLAAVGSDAARLASDAAKAAVEAVKGVAEAPAPAPTKEAAPDPAANAFVEPAPAAAAVEVAFAPKSAHLPDERAKLDRLISHYADAYDVPKDLVHRVVRRESNYRPTAYNSGNWGLMQIRHATARGLGYDGKAEGLLDPETNLRYAVRYLRGAYIVAGGDKDHAIRLYQRGYYYDAKRAGLLDETGLGRDRVRRRQPG